MMRLSISEQHQHKREWVCDLLTGAGLEIPAVVPMVAASSDRAYRNRIRLKVGDKGELGFFNVDKLDDCMVLTDSLSQLIAELRSLAKAEPALVAAFEYLEARSADQDGMRAVSFHERPGAIASDFSRLRQCLGEQTLAHISSESTAEGGASQRFSLCEQSWSYVPLGSFMQVNHAVNHKLVAHFLDRVAHYEVEDFMDLYCGAGNLSLPLLVRGLKGGGVELSAVSVKAARQAAIEQGLSVDSFRCADVAEQAAIWINEGGNYDLVIANPPRAGLRRAVECVGALSRRHIALCSCNPDTLAGDLLRLVELGFELRELTLFDMFPHTRHVESVAWMTRRR